MPTKATTASGTSVGCASARASPFSRRSSCTARWNWIRSGTTPSTCRFTDFYVQWTKSPRIVLTVGKQGVPFTLDGANSSRELLTIDRSNLANNMWFPTEYLPGVSVSGRRAAWVYRVGVYSSGAANREFGEFNGGTATLGVIGYDFAPKLKVREALLSGNYVYQTADRDNTFTRQFDHIGSINFRFEDGKWGARTDFTIGVGLSRAKQHVGDSGDAVLQHDEQVPSRRPLHVHRQRRFRTASVWPPTKAASSAAEATNTTSCISARTITSTVTG